VLEFAGAFLVGGHVTKTIRKGIIDPQVAMAMPDEILYGMLAALAAAATWLLVATRAGWPVSTTHSIVGAIAGFGAVALGTQAVNWGQLGTIAVSWVVSPLLSGSIAFVVFTIIQRSILNHPRPVQSAQRWGPVYIFAVVLVIGFVTLFKGLKNLKLDFDLPTAFALSALIGIVIAGLGSVWIRRSQARLPDDEESQYRAVERMFAVLQIGSACAVAFAHGSNDVANAIGPLAAVFQVLETGGLEAAAPVPPWMLALGGIGIVVGLSTLGYRVMATVGERITELTPTRGYAAEFAAALTIAVASRLGIPVSTTHTLVGAVLGVGLARGIGALDYRVVGMVVVSWVVTIPAGASLAIFFFFFFKGLFITFGG
jgi:PiT family inorganic phosphate transporter